MVTSSSTSIFVSHSHIDNDFCLRLIKDLRHVLADENAVWYDSGGGLQGGDSWWPKIMQEIKARPIFIVVLSPDSMTSKWVNSEIDLAWKHKHSSIGKHIIPLLYRACETRDDLDTLHIISFLSPISYEDALKNLIQALDIPIRQTEEQKIRSAPQPPYYNKHYPHLRRYGPSSPTEEEWCQEGLKHTANQQYAQALTDFENAIAINPNYLRAYTGRGNTYDSLKQYDQAIADYTHAITIDSKNVDAYFRRGLSKSELKRYDEAIADYDRAIALNPNYANAYHGRGRAYAALNKRKQSKEDFDHFSKLTTN